MWMERQSKQEHIIYLALWGILFAAPVLSLYLRSINEANITFQWDEVFMIWRRFSVYFILFLIHNFFIAPLLVYKHKRVVYTLTIAVFMGCFIVYQCYDRPKDIPISPSMERGMNGRPGEMGELPPPYENGEFLSEEDLPPMEDFGPEGEGGPGASEHKPMRGPDGKERRHVPPAIIGEHDIVAVIVLFLLFGMNVGIKIYFRTREDQKKLVELEKQNLEQQLEYLKYQINPHFFMNTLNNIHALVDIDAEKAKSTILELSKMMRFILYEGNKNGVPLTREFEFIRTYVTLMRLRYTDKVSINVELPSLIPDKLVPPLMLITFIENAFKHGISYQHESFVVVKVDIKDDKLFFTCRNSKADKPNQEKGGVGLTNVRQRLDLLFGHNYTLDIQNEPDIYNVQLTIPLL